jgi:ribose 1,5-bisphosphokinase
MSPAHSSLQSDPAAGLPGRLVLIVGPSGVGKDSLLDGARRAFAARSDMVFPRRIITRAPDSHGGENHVAVSESQFHEMVRAGALALHWQAHGLYYGIPSEVNGPLRAGHTVVANVSRAVIDQARRRYPGLRVICVTALPETLRRRLLNRGRESAGAIEARLHRAAEIAVAGEDVVFCSNDGSLQDGIARFTALLERINTRQA